MKIQAYSMAFNEATWVEQWVASCRKFCDVVTLFDNGSTDGTQDLARAAGAEVIAVQPPQGRDVLDYNNPKFGHAQRRNWCINRLTGDWIFNLDVDEVLVAADAGALHRLAEHASDEATLAFAFQRFTLWMDEGFYRADWVDSVPWLWKNGIGIHYGKIDPPHENLVNADDVNIRALSPLVPVDVASIRHYHYVRGWKALRHLNISEDQRLAEVARLKADGSINVQPVPWKEQ